MPLYLQKQLRSTSIYTNRLKTTRLLVALPTEIHNIPPEYFGNIKLEVSEMEKHQQFGQMIKFFRQQKKMTQDDLAVGICTPSYLSRIENGLVAAEQVVYELLFERLSLNFEQYIQQEQAEQKFLQAFYNDLLSNEPIQLEQLQTLQQLYTSKTYPSLQIQVELIYARYLLSEHDIKAASTILQSLESLITPSNTREWQLFVAVKTYADLSAAQYEMILKREQSTNSIHFFTSTSPFEKANYLYHLAFASHRAYQFTKALRFIEMAKQTFTHQYKPLFQLKLYSMHGVIYNALGRFNESIHEYEAGIDLLKHVPSIASDEQWASIYNNLAFTYESQNNYEEAQNYYQKSLSFKQDVHTKVNYCRTLLFSNAIDILTQQLGDLWEKEIESGTHHHYQLLLIHALIQQPQQEPEAFLQVERKVMKYFTQYAHIELILSYGPHVAKICEALHQYKRASELYKLLFETSEKMRSRLEREEMDV